MHLFSPASLGPIELSNRIVLPPMVTKLASDDGHVTDAMLDHYRTIAENGCGLIIVEASSVNQGRRLGGPGIWDFSFLPELQELATVIHRSGARTVIQLADSLRSENLRPATLSERQIETIREDYIAAAARAHRAGFDGVELHCAHGFSLADFLSRIGNHRTDGYGGAVKGRCRLVAEIMAGIRERVNDDLFAIGCRINGDEFLAGGNTLKDAMAIARQLEQSGADFIHVSAGARREGGADSYSMKRCEPDMWFENACNIHLAEGVKRAVKIPVIGVGKIATPVVAERILKGGKADLVAVGRAQIADPQWVKKGREGRFADIRRCRYCNHCLGEIGQGRPVSCILDKE